ncbi:MAG: hypothetical protein PHS80_11500 [Methanothrix sp.]|nr:hypothetical protein [Methanothrix sp.]MDD4448488.1 hypothetical protein [Methanothrix sp.]
MPDAKYGSDEPAFWYSNAPNYTGIMKEAISEMHVRTDPRLGNTLMPGATIMKADDSF